jgi:hypothetical protein
MRKVDTLQQGHEVRMHWWNLVARLVTAMSLTACYSSAGAQARTAGGRVEETTAIVHVTAIPMDRDARSRTRRFSSEENASLR